jgi:hypothetical protein
MEAIGNVYKVEKVRQTEVEDIFKVSEILPHGQNGEIIFEKFPRTMELSCEDVLAYYE